ncbi:hypothetical protein [Aeromicrobium sp.]|uniref:hypothetical protein n=1 Tax=Aeromicrobium sp. TaxID=1871063 RepID=UPI0019B8BAF6|nr:hypothetical protein [Aeromicrobium sp.]MBC7630672.1 hypothetical protein [Aeromicrobium sp.]
MRKLLLSVVSALAVVLVAAPPASAAGELGLSRNGVTFAPALSGPLFDEGIRWVPGDIRSATFYVRNQGEAPARLTVDVLGAQMSELLDSGDLRVTASGGGESQTVSDASAHRLLTLPDLEDREIVPITVAVELVKDSTNETQLLSSDLTFRINLRQTAAVLGAELDGNRNGKSNGDELSGLLPDTGAPAPWWAAALAAISVGSGAALLLSRRTHPKGASHG